MPFPDPMPGYRTQYENRSDAPRYGVRACGWGLAAAMGVPVAVVIGIAALAAMRLIHALLP